MKKQLLTRGPIIGLTALLAACASTPPESPELKTAQASYEAASETPEIARAGSTHLRKAKEALDKAEAMLLAEGDPGIELEHQIYLANRQIDIAREAGEQAALQEELQGAERQRDKLRIQIGERRAQIAEMEARMLKEQMERLQAEHTDRGMVMTLGDVLFDIDKADLKPGGVQTVERLAEFMKEYENYRVRVEGYTDSTGEASYNRDLSLRRAQAVRDELLQEGISADRIEVQGFGEEYPKATNTSAAGRQENRRVEIVISDREGNIQTR